MATKRAVKLTEARILVYLNQVTDNRKYIKAISLNLGIDYGYCILTLQRMKLKGWVRVAISLADPRKKYYELTNAAPIEASKELIVRSLEKEKNKQSSEAGAGGTNGN